MVEKLLQLLHVTCSHKNTSHPFTASEPAPDRHSHDWESVGEGAQTYVVCLDCGKKFRYDWERMKIVR